MTQSIESRRESYFKNPERCRQNYDEAWYLGKHAHDEAVALRGKLETAEAERDALAALVVGIREKWLPALLRDAREPDKVDCAVASIRYAIACVMNNAVVAYHLARNRVVDVVLDHRQKLKKARADYQAPNVHVELWEAWEQLKEAVDAFELAHENMKDVVVHGRRP